MMALSDDRMSQWLDRRSRRLAEIGWIRQEVTSGGAIVRYVADELLVRDDHAQLARTVITGQGHRAADVQEDGAGVPTGYRRYRVRDLDVPRAARSIRRRARADGDDRVAASPNHVLVSAPFEQGGPFGPPVPAAHPGHDLIAPSTEGLPGVAVVDTGVWRDSPLTDELYDATPEDYESDVDVDNDGILDGDVGHANFIAGVILRETRQARVRIVRVLDTFGVCTEAQLIEALARAARYRIVNLSLGGFTLDDEPPMPLQDALDKLLATGDRLIVAAAGNDGQRDRPFWPAAFAASDQPWRDRVVAVAAHDGTEVCHWSNAGDWVTLAAPGADVTSTFVRHETFHSGWAQWSGTSFATPYVVAAVAEQLTGPRSATEAVATMMAKAQAHNYSGYPGLP
jgi:thermitase